MIAIPSQIYIPGAYERETSLRKSIMKKPEENNALIYATIEELRREGFEITSDGLYEKNTTYNADGSGRPLTLRATPYDNSTKSFRVIDPEGIVDKVKVREVQTLHELISDIELQDNPGIGFIDF